MRDDLNNVYHRKRLLSFVLFCPFFASLSGPVAGEELRGVCGDFTCLVFTSPSWRRYRASLLLGHSSHAKVKPFEGQRLHLAPQVFLRPEYWPCPLHDAVRISLNLTSKFGHCLTHRQPWTASYFALTRAHQHGIAVGPRNGQSCV